MDRITHVSPEWQGWITDNLQRGCAPMSLVEVMVEKNFDPMFANAVVFQLSSSAQSVPAVGTTAAGGAYQYEAPRFNHVDNVIRTADRDVRIVSRIGQPVIAVLDGLLSPEECDELICQSEQKLQRSTIVDPQTGKHEVIADRSSFGTFFTLNENDFIARLDARIAAVMNWPIENGEGIQILNYKTAGEYKPHYDYFPVADPGSQMHLNNGGQRVSTMVMYLNDVASGGETIFPELGLSVTPKKGSAVYFEYTNSQEQVDPLTLHGGAPVSAGEKWIATKWMRQRRFG
ncbi:2OG-Fe(II) oxygenase [Jeongeupia sp. HS-3]|uniref:2OG-Fe(II) oxygenase n=1 Tax=Jeongeupia sp. HS-3 TaxID=1009682 RepID=UPI00191100EA|nr:2OG-Fe(II) oxygenase [Jeongeupia sp. HS-3]